MDPWRHELMTQSVHFHQWCKTGQVTGVVEVLAAGQSGTGTGLHSDCPKLPFPLELIRQEGENKTAEIAPASVAGDDNVRIAVNAG